MLKVALEEAKLASEEIDHTLSVEQSRRKKDKAIRILLLGVYAVSLPSSGSESCRRPCRVFHAVTLTLTRVLMQVNLSQESPQRFAISS